MNVMGDTDIPNDVLTPADEVVESVRKLFMWAEQGNHDYVDRGIGVVKQSLRNYDEWRAGTPSPSKESKTS
jgi:hypothetical protein